MHSTDIMKINWGEKVKKKSMLYLAELTDYAIGCFWRKIVFYIFTGTDILLLLLHDLYSPNFEERVGVEE